MRRADGHDRIGSCEHGQGPILCACRGVRSALLTGIEARYARLRAGESPHSEWSTRLATLGQVVEATIAEGTLIGVAESVDGDGALLLRTPDGGLHRLVAGDVTLHKS